MSCQLAGLRRRPGFAVVLVVVLLLLLGGRQGQVDAQTEPPATAAATESTGDSTPGAAEPAGRLFEEVHGFTDQYGRVPLSRLTFAPGAELPAGLLPGAFIAVVEAGSFDVIIDASTSAVGPGEHVEVAEGETLSARNNGRDEGSWLVLLQYDDLDAFLAHDSALSYSFVCPECQPAGLTNALLFSHMGFVDRLAPVRFTVDRVTLPPGAALDSIDLGGETEAVAFYLRVESGAVELVESGDVVEAGSEEFQGNVEVVAAEGVRAVGPEAAVILIVRKAEF